MTTALILNIALDALVFAVIGGKLLWAIATQHRDRGLTHVSGQRHHRTALQAAAHPRPQGRPDRPRPDLAPGLTASR